MMSDTELTEPDYSYELCKSALQMAFHEDYIVEAGMNWENSERFRKILREMKKEYQH